MIALAAALALLAAPGAPPPVETLFGCALDGPPAAFATPAEWEAHDVSDLGVHLQLPRGWTVVTDGDVATGRSQDGRHRITVRRGRLVGHERLAFVRRSVELTELGPSHASEACEARLAERLRAFTGWDPLVAGVYGRPLGGRQRSYAMYAGLPDGSVTVVVTTRWPEKASGPDLDLVRRLLAGVRRFEAPP